jgi:hypothetical protein
MNMNSIRNASMSKATVTRLFIGSVIAAGAGAVLAIVGVWLAIENGVFVMSGQDVVGLQGGAASWILLGLGLVGAIAFTGGLIGGFVSWIGALLNTAQLDSKAWFLGLLLLGIFNVGFFAMIAYLIAGPDGTAAAPSHRAPATASA